MNRYYGGGSGYGRGHGAPSDQLPMSRRRSSQRSRAGILRMDNSINRISNCAPDDQVAMDISLCCYQCNPFDPNFPHIGKHHWYGDIFFENTPYEIYLSYPVSERDIATIPREILEKLLRCWEVTNITDPDEVAMEVEMVEWMDRWNVEQMNSGRDLTEERIRRFLGRPEGPRPST